MTKDELIEQLAEVEHQRWADWQRWVHEGAVPVPDSLDHAINPGCLILLPEDVEGWERQIATPYAELSEREKQSDREQVMRYLPLVIDFVAGWIAENTTEDGDCYGELNAEQWRLEMGEEARP